MGQVNAFFIGAGDPSWTGEDTQGFRDRSIKLFEDLIARGEGNEDIANFLADLRNSDWSNKESYNKFQNIYDEYEKRLGVGEDIDEEIKSLFRRNPLK